MEEETKKMEMFSYYGDGKELWTSNGVFAEIRANYYGTKKVYVEVIEIEEEKK